MLDRSRCGPRLVTASASGSGSSWPSSSSPACSSPAPRRRGGGSSYALDGAPAPVPLAGPLKLSLSFFLPRPKDHQGARGLLPHAPARPTTRPDLLKLTRAVEDACTGILWRDDAQIVDEELHKAYADGEGARIGVLVGVTPLAPKVPPA
jgi:Holliday junction resolvase RusA-like endonuclease